MDARSLLVAQLERSRSQGYLGAGPVEDHLEHAVAFARPVRAEPDRVLDLGSGGGLPGLVLAALCWPQASWTLLDSSKRRAAFLTDAVGALSLTGRVAVVHARAEDLGHVAGHRGQYDLVVARSFGPPAVVAECGAGFLRVGGRLVVSEPPVSPGGDVAASARWPADGVSVLGYGPVSISIGPPRLAVLEQVGGCPDRFPRRAGVPARRPLF